MIEALQTERSDPSKSEIIAFGEMKARDINIIRQVNPGSDFLIKAAKELAGVAIELVDTSEIPVVPLDREDQQQLVENIVTSLLDKTHESSVDEARHIADDAIEFSRRNVTQLLDVNQEDTPSTSVLVPRDFSEQDIEHERLLSDMLASKDATIAKLQRELEDAQDDKIQLLLRSEKAEILTPPKGKARRRFGSGILKIGNFINFAR